MIQGVNFSNVIRAFRTLATHENFGSERWGFAPACAQFKPIAEHGIDAAMTLQLSTTLGVAAHLTPDNKKRARQPLSKNYPLQVQMCTPGVDGQSSNHERSEIERIRKFFLRFRVSGALGSTTFGTRPHKGAREHKGAPKKI